MFQITAVFNRHCLNEVLAELFDSKIEGVTVIDVAGKGSHTQTDKDKPLELYEKVMIIVVVPSEEKREMAKDAIRALTQDIEHGAGKMWITPVLEVERIRTGEKNELALTRSNPDSIPTINTFYTAVDTPSS